MRKLTPLVAALLVAGTAACGSEPGIPSALDEYSIRLDDGSLPAGPQAFNVHNVGQIAHQFLVLRTADDPGELPVGKDGVVRLDAKGIEEVAEVEIVAPGERQLLEVDLAAGRYAVICNIAGHYSSGMHTGLRVG